MKPRQKLKATILKMCGDTAHLEVSKDNVDKLFRENYDILRDTISEFRRGEFSTDMRPCDHTSYESRSVGAKMYDGSLVGWTYYYGGGGNAKPEDVEWMDESYNIKVDREYWVLLKTYKIIY